jgi:digeranylgeranylglycerophospholipid reductase
VKSVHDAVVIGGGPAGSFSAYQLAKQSLAVCVFEEHPKIGEPSHCAGHLSIRSLRNLGLYPLPDGIVENTFSTANFYSPNGTKFSVHLTQPVTCAVNRAKFDHFLAQKAEAAGAKFCLGTRVQSLMIEGGYVKGVNVATHEATETVHAKLVVDAEGISSRVLRQAGLQALDGGKMVYAVEAEIDNVSGVEEHGVEVYVGKTFAPGFYGWLIPRLDGTAKLGLATNCGNPKLYLQQLMQHHPVAKVQLQKAKIKHLSYHAIPLGGPIPKTYTNGFLAVGDCASQVKPTTGGGVVFSLTCAQIAAETANQALQKGDVSEEALGLYQKQFMDQIGFDMKVMLKAREAVDSFSDKKIDRAFSFLSKVGFGKALRDIDEIDFQGKTLFTVLKKPSSYAALAYLLGLYLSANA